jgi:hypothetical protein
MLLLKFYVTVSVFNLDYNTKTGDEGKEKIHISNISW